MCLGSSASFEKFCHDKEVDLKGLFFKLAFLYARIYGFFSYHRKKERREEIAGKLDFFLARQWNPGQRQKVVRHIFELRGARKIQRYVIPWMDAGFIRKFVEVDGLGNVNRVLQSGRGIVLMAAHFGNPHMGFNALRAMGYDLAVIKGGLPREFKHRRFRYADIIKETIFVGDPSLAQQYKERILETLRSGKMIAHYGDAKEGRLKEKTPFLGKEMAFPTGMIHLAHQANAAIIPFIHLYRRGKITLIFKEPIDRHWKEGKGEYRRVLEEFTKLLESYIVMHPEQYMGIYGPTVLAYYYQSHRKGELSQGEK